MDVFERAETSFSIFGYLMIAAAAALAGVAVLSILPPFEGFDETAHWSRLQQMADTGQSPIYGLDTLSTDLAHYRGPTPAGAPGAIRPTVTYEGFRRTGAPTLIMRPGVYGKGGFRNWEAQHPPLYYWGLAPLFKITAGLLLKNQVLALRLASWSLAVSGLLIAAEGARRFLPDGSKIALAIVAWPFFVPEFLPEMARLGNDSLCLLLTGACWAALMRLLSPKGGWGSASALGALLGFGLLTKALFLPIVAGTVLLLVLRWVKDRSLARAREAVLVLGLAAVIGLWWYLDRHATTGSFSGSDEFIQFQKRGGTFLGNLVAHFSLAELWKGLLDIAVGFLWGGTWSLAQPHTGLLLGPALLIGIPIAFWLKAWRTMEWSDLAALSWILPLGASLIYHVLMLIAFAGDGSGTPGHYLHIAAPAFALAVARGWRWRTLGMLTAAWTVLFTGYIWTEELALFSGCASKHPVTNHYVFDQGCFIDGHSLGVLAHPFPAALALILCAAGLLIGAYRLRQRLFGSSVKTPDELRPLFELI